MIIEDHGDFQTNDEYWDCMCKDGYIHLKKNGTYCPICKIGESMCPDSRVNEIERHYISENDIGLEDE